MCCPGIAMVIDQNGDGHHFPKAKEVMLSEDYEIAQCQNGQWVWVTNNCDPKPALPNKPCTNEGSTIAVPC